MNLLYRWAWAMYSKSQFCERLIARLTVEQRNVLGFPAPGNKYWTKQTIIAVAARYACWGMDMKPYEDALPENSVTAGLFY